MPLSPSPAFGLHGRPEKGFQFRLKTVTFLYRNLRRGKLQKQYVHSLILKLLSFRLPLISPKFASESYEFIVHFPKNPFFLPISRLFLGISRQQPYIYIRYGPGQLGIVCLVYVCLYVVTMMLNSVILLVVFSICCDICLFRCFF